MARKVSLEGSDVDPVPINFMAPLWIKRRASEAAAALGKQYSDFCRDAIRDAADLALAHADRRAKPTKKTR